MKLAWKLTVLLFACICAVLAIYTAIRIDRERAQLDADLRRRHSEIAHAIEIPLVEVWQLDGEARAMGMVERISRGAGRPSVRWVWLSADTSDYYRPRAPLDQLTPLANDEMAYWLDEAEQPGGRWYAYAPIRVPDPRRGALELSESLAPRQEKMRSMVLGVVAATASIAMLFGLAAMVVGVAVVGRPVERMIRLAQGVTRGDFEMRLEETHGEDELAELAREMNKMAQELADKDHRLEREAEARIRTMERLKHADRVMMIGTLAAEVAHELGTPLTVVATNAKMIAAREMEGDEAVTSAKTIAEQADRMTTIIRQILDYARRRTAERTPQDLWGSVKAACELLRPMATKHNVKIKVIGDDGQEKRACVNAVQMQQLLANLMMNGIQAMPQGGALEIGVTEEAPDQAGRALRVFVRDYGVGIGDARASQIIEPFFTTKPAGEGTGLGLAVVSSIVQDHGGRIQFESPPGGGTKVSIFLPLEVSA